MSGRLSQDHVGAAGPGLVANASTDHASCLWIMESLLLSAAGEIIVLRVTGEVDLVTISVLEAALASNLDRRPAHLVVDLAGLQFCSAQGMGVLFSARTTAAERGVGYAISSVSPRLECLWERLWPDELPTRYHSEAAAVDDIRTRQTHPQADDPLVRCVEA